MGGLGGNKKFAYQNHCNRQGFDVTAKHGYKLRFGIIFNEQNNCNSPDTMIGVGMQSAAKMSAGGYCGCCQNGGSARRLPPRSPSLWRVRSKRSVVRPSLQKVSRSK